MTDLTAQRTLVKSPPELWSELSEVENLARHLGELGEIRIVKVEPESTVAWEGEEVSGTVELEQSGWGTKVTFRATVPEPDASAEPEAVPLEPDAVAEPEPVADVAIEPEHLEVESEPRGFFAKWLFRRRQPAREPVAVERGPVAAVSGPAAVEPELVPVAIEAEPVEREPVAETGPAAASETQPVAAETEAVVPTAADRVQEVLDGTLDTLGQAHHRPFSRG